MARKKLKQYGLPRSGTNAVRWLFERHYDVEVLTTTGGGKHWFWCWPETRYEADGILVSVKNPYAWMESLWRHMVNNPFFIHGNTWSDYLRQKIGIYDGGRRIFFATPAWAWNAMNWHWMTVNTKDAGLGPVMAVRAEDMLDPAAAERTGVVIAEQLGLDRLDNDFTWPRGRLAALSGRTEEALVPQEMTDLPFHINHYRQGHFLERYSAEDIHDCNMMIDWQLATRFGYAPVAPDSRDEHPAALTTSSSSNTGEEEGQPL